MKCLKCHTGKIQVKQTWTIGEGVRVQRGKCNNCGSYVAMQTVTIVVEVDPKEGKGAYAIAKRSKPPNASAAGTTIV